MKLSEVDVRLYNKVFQLALQYTDKTLHDEHLGQQIRKLRDRHKEASNQESTPEKSSPIIRCSQHDDQNTSCPVCYPPVNVLFRVPDKETREQGSKDIQEAIVIETDDRIGQAGCRSGECD